MGRSEGRENRCKNGGGLKPGTTRGFFVLLFKEIQGNKAGRWGPNLWEIDQKTFLGFCFVFRAF